ncbi:hypothetical protein ASD66_09435 [Nocardioides sp. Root151]|nr:hypothetical protein ASD30_03190 [Nocardioides sp. Root140]KQZ70844.1 hypothetical protein ASD66_09435 [Nocardioides sp. Root151]KRF16408.1 hypothetical protein ASH02_05195 [Nocardioides sp. Soil796]
MFAFRESRGGEAGGASIDLAFTDRTLDLSLPAAGDDGVVGEVDEAAATARLATLAGEFAPGEHGLRIVGLRQVHGAEVAVLDASYDGRELVADAIVTTQPGVALLVRAADCVPVLLADERHTVVGAVHSGRPGLVAGVVPAAVRAMRDLGAGPIAAWIGPHVCGSCYEVPGTMRADVAAVVPESWAETSWGTPALDIGAGVRAQLVSEGVTIVDASRCTREEADLWSYRRDGAAAGRLGGLIRIRP